MQAVIEREFDFTHKDFTCLCKLVDKHTGIQLSDGKQDMVYGRLARRLRWCQLSSFQHYIALLEADTEGEEFGEFINAMTTNLTSFFRESHHFDYLKQTVLPELMQCNKANRKIRIWSAGCSTGEEPYSIAMTVADVVPAGWDVKILATDLDTDVLAHAERGIYSIERIDGLNKALTQRWFQKNKHVPDKVRVNPELQAMISFGRLNLLKPWPMQAQIDVVFCRNVIIYFDMPTKKTLMHRYAEILPDAGYLFLGHSEAMHEMSTRFSLCGKSVYMKAPMP